jgi:tape measure domain-containing protein
VQSALGDLRTYALAVLAPVAHMGQSFLDAGMRASTAFETANVKMERMLGSAEETKDMMAKLTTFAAVTPFEMPQLLQATNKLVAFGDRGEELMDTLKLIGDASGGTAAEFGALSHVFNKVRSSGRMTMEEFNQLSDRGILTLQDFVKAGVAPTTKAVTEMQSKGKLSFELFQKTLEMTTKEGGRNFEAMLGASKTMEGRTSTLSDAIGILGRHVSEASVPFAKFSIDLKIKAVEALDAFVMATNGAGAGAIIGGIKAAKLGTALLGVALSAKLAGIAMKGLGLSMKAAIMGTGVGIAIIAIGAAVGALYNWFMKTEVGMAAVAYFSEQLGVVWIALKSAAIEVGSALSGMFEAVFGASFESYLGAAGEYIASWITWFADKLVVGAKWVEWLAKEIGYWIRNGVDIAKVVLIDMTLKLIDVFGEDRIMTWATAFMGIFSGLKAFFASWVENITSGFKSVFNVLSAELAGAWAAGEALLSGSNPMEAYTKAWSKEVESQDPLNFSNPVTAYATASAAAMDAMQEQFGEEGMSAGLMSEKQKLLDAIAEREGGRNKTPKEKEEEEEDAAPDGEEEKKADTEASMKGGKFGFAAFGDKIQDAILKKDEGIGKLVSINELGNTIQQQQLTATENLNVGLGP